MKQRGEIILAVIGVLLVVEAVYWMTVGAPEPQGSYTPYHDIDMYKDGVSNPDEWEVLRYEKQESN